MHGTFRRFSWRGWRGGTTTGRRPRHRRGVRCSAPTVAPCSTPLTSSAKGCLA